MNLANLAIKRPTFITALILVILIVGLIFMNRMGVDMFPDVNFPYISVTTLYSGAGPEEIETQITKKLEEQISRISGLKDVYSVSQDGYSIVWAEFTLETNAKYAEQQVKDKVALVRADLPDGVKEPVIQSFDPADRPVITLSVTASLSPTELYDLADTKIRNALEQVPNISQVEIVGGTKRQIHVDLDLNKLEDYDTTVTAVAGHITANSQNVPIGKVDRGSVELAFRTIGEFRSVQQINNVIVSFLGSDVPITLNKVGVVKDDVERVKTIGYLNGKAALVMNIFKQSDSNTVAVSDSIINRIKKLNKELEGQKGAPAVVLVRDMARSIRLNLKDVAITIFEGILLAILVVYLFLGNFRSTFITIVALPNSLIGAFIFMGLAHFTINMLSLMALSLAVGLLIDDAIVVRENIFRHMENGEDAKTASLKGTNEVQLAVIATTVTVIAVFLPVGFLQGMVGQFFKQFGLTIVFAMTISLFDALTTAPMLSAYLMGNVNKKITYKGLGALLHAPAASFEKFQQWLERMYEKIMNHTLKHKIRILVGAVIIFFASLFVVSGVPKTFMPANEWGEFFVDLEATPGTSLSQMESYSMNIESLLRKQKNVEMVLSTIGNSTGESNVSSLYIKLVPQEKRKETTSETKEYIRKILLPFKDKLTLSVADVSMGGSDSPFSLLLAGDNIDQLAQEADKLMAKLKDIKGLVDLRTNFRPGKPEFQIKLDSVRMENLGVESITAGMELRGMVDGITAAKYRENGQEYDVLVHLQDDQQDLDRRFNQLYVPNINRQRVRLNHIADGVIASGPTKINRRNRARYVMIEGNLGVKGAIGDITKEARTIIKKNPLPSEIKCEFLGSSEDIQDLFKNMIIAAALSIVFIYFALASLYESVVIPLTIMTALPLAIIGGLLGLFIFGQTINMFTMIGFIMLLGLTTKNSILLVDFAQRLMRRGLPRNEAIIKAGLTRLRPILMTTFALIAGMTPLALGLSEMGRFRQSMGIAVIGGLLSSTFLTLIIIPAIFGYMDDLRMWLRKVFRRPPLREFDKIVDNMTEEIK